MDTTLKNHHKATAVLICFIIHSILIVTIMIVDMHTNAEHEPIILIANQEQENALQEPTSMQSMPQEEWVAMSSGLPNASFNAAPTPPAIQENAIQEIAQESTEQPADIQPTQIAQKEPTQAQQTALEKSLDEVLELATQFMQERAPQETKKAEAKPVESPAEKIESKLEKFTQKQKQITLAQIAQGFVSHMQQAPSEGSGMDSGMDVASNKHGQASMNQLQQLHYCQKIIGCIVNSYKINRFNLPGVQQENRLCVHLALKQDGSIHTLRLVQSSGNNMLDQFVLATFKDASSSFPPLPQTFKQIPYHLPFFNIDRIESLQTTQGWYIDSRHS